MMKISAVVCELNPAHVGHEYIFDKARQVGDIVVAVMSGNFVQRGENAIFDKYKRAASALDIGADLVLELPFPWNCASAQYFAAASVHIAESIGCTDLVFGSECGDVEALKRAAQIMLKEDFNVASPACVRAAEYREELLYKLDPTLPKGILSSANDILGVEYIKNLKFAVPHPFKRVSCHSASSIRADMKKERNAEPDAVFYDGLQQLIFHKLRCNSASEISTAEAQGGVGQRLYKAALDSVDPYEMMCRAATKQYTNARLKRCGLYYLTNVTKDNIESLPLFTNVLAFNSIGRDYLSHIRKNASVKIITKPSSFKNLEGTAYMQAEKSAYADSIFALITKKPADHFVRSGPVIKLDAHSK